jgi:hypothetical protein
MKRSLILSLLSCVVLSGVAYTTRSQTQPPAASAPADPMASALAPNINPFLATGRDKLDTALVRLGDTAMTADLSTNEPWLFDRATTFYKLALWSGEQRFEDHAFALVERYYSLIDANGEFSLKPGDAKYSYVDGAVWYEHATGQRKFRPQAEAVYGLWLTEFPAQYSASSALWTEREIAYAFGAALGWYELSRDPAALARARGLVQQWAHMAEGSGAPLHTLAQHQEEFEPPWGDERMSSPWMSALFFEYLQHYERVTGDPLALTLVSEYADFLLANCLYDGSRNHPNLAGYLMPYYLCGDGGKFYEKETPSESDGEHAVDVMGILASAVYAKRKLELDAAPTLAAYRRLRESAILFVGRRTDVSPARKINWWIGSSYDSSELVQ